MLDDINLPRMKRIMVEFNLVTSCGVFLAVQSSITISDNVMKLCPRIEEIKKICIVLIFVTCTNLLTAIYIPNLNVYACN